MRKDLAHLINHSIESLGGVRQLGKHLRVSKYLPLLIWCLVFGTSMAVALLSWWLVPPYLAVMGMLLYEPKNQSHDIAQRVNPKSDELIILGQAQHFNAFDVTDSEHLTTSSPATTAIKTRRATRSRAKKTRPLVENTAASWLQVAPGKFVRIESEVPVEEYNEPALNFENQALPSSSARLKANGLPSLPGTGSATLLILQK